MPLKDGKKSIFDSLKGFAKRGRLLLTGLLIALILGGFAVRAGFISSRINPRLIGIWHAKAPLSAISEVTFQNNGRGTFMHPGTALEFIRATRNTSIGEQSVVEPVVFPSRLKDFVVTTGMRITAAMQTSSRGDRTAIHLL